MPFPSSLSDAEHSLEFYTRDAMSRTLQAYRNSCTLNALAFVTNQDGDVVNLDIPNGSIVKRVVLPEATISNPYDYLDVQEAVAIRFNLGDIVSAESFGSRLIIADKDRDQPLADLYVPIHIQLGSKARIFLPKGLKHARVVTRQPEAMLSVLQQEAGKQIGRKRRKIVEEATQMFIEVRDAAPTHVLKSDHATHPRPV